MTFIEYAGAAWLRLPDGDIEATPYCPTCHKVMAIHLGHQHYSCVDCIFTTSFKKSDLRAILSHIPTETSVP